MNRPEQSYQWEEQALDSDRRQATERFVIIPSAKEVSLGSTIAGTPVIARALEEGYRPLPEKRQ